MGIFQYQPLKALYIIHVLLSTYCVAVPFWYLKYALFGPLRPSWSLSETVKVLATRRVQLILEHCRIAVDTRNPEKPVPEESMKETSFVAIKAPRRELIKGVADHPVHKPLPQITGHAWPKGQPLGKKEGKVMLFLHGGGYYVLHAGEKASNSDIPRKAIQYSNSLSGALSVEYRTLTYGGFPCQLLDAFAGYAHLVETLGIDPSRIVVSGDSAGAHLCHNLVRYLKDTQVLPMPGLLLLFSPWADMDVSIAERPNKDYDYLRLTGLHYTPEIFLNLKDKRAPPISIISPYVSPVAKRVEATKDLFEGFPKTFIHYGGAETLARDATEMKRRMDISGVDCTIYEQKEAVHDALVLDWFQPKQQRRVWQKIVDWIDAN